MKALLSYPWTPFCFLLRYVFAVGENITVELTPSYCATFISSEQQRVPCRKREFEAGNIDPIIHQLLPSISERSVMIHITNFPGSPLTFTHFPVVLRRPFPILMDGSRLSTSTWWEAQEFYEYDNGTTNLWKLLKWRMLPAKENWNSTRDASCTSHFVGPGKDKSAYLNFLRFTSSSKPWNVEMVLHLFPPSNILCLHGWQQCGLIKSSDRLRPFPKVWVLEDPDRAILAQSKVAYTFPSSQPFTAAIIVSNDDYLHLLRYNEYKVINTVFKDRFDRSFAQVENQNMYLVSVENPTTPLIHRLSNFNDKTPDDEIFVVLEDFFKRNRNFLHDLYCDHHFSAQLDPIATEFAKIWQSLLPNMTTLDFFSGSYLSDSEMTWANFNTDLWSGVVCQSEGKLVSVTKRITDIPLYPSMILFIAPAGSLWQAHFQFENVLQGMRFISCGEQPVKGLPFEALLAAFHADVWVALALTCAAVVLFLSKLDYNHQSIGYGFRLVKVLLEQGSPFPGSLFSHRSLPSTMGVLVMLVGIILSNAYKNVNVYNMITPRQLIPYKFFEQLYRDNFTVFHRGTMIEEDAKTLREYIGMETRNTSEMGIYYREFAYFWRNHTEASEEEGNVIARVHSELEYWELFDQEELPGNKTALDIIMRRTGMLPFKWQELLWNIGSNAGEFGAAIVKMFGTDLAFEALRYCNRTAVILPYQECLELLKELRSENILNANVGEERYFEWSGSLILEGYWPRFVVRRVKLVQAEAGICERTIKLVLQRVYSNDMEPGKGAAKERPSMTGNILVIFAVLGTGLVVSTLKFLAEVVTLWDCGIQEKVRDFRMWTARKKEVVELSLKL